MAKKNRKIKGLSGHQAKRMPEFRRSAPSRAGDPLRQALALHQAGRTGEAEVLYRQILQANPRHPEALHFLGLLAHQTNRSDIAAELIRKALSFKPDYLEALNNLGIIFQSAGNFEEAIACFRRALDLKPNYADLHYNLGNALLAQNRLEEAADSTRRALSFRPDYIEALSNLGIILKRLDQPEEAIACYRHALSLNPAHIQTYCNLGTALKDIGELGEAIANYRHALALRPDFFEAHSNLLLCLNYLPGLNASQYLEEARRYGQRVAAAIRKRFTEWSCLENPTRLRVGMVSGDFRNHPVGYFLENIVTHLDPDRIELIAYPTGGKEDELTGRLRPRFLAWKPLFGKGDAAAARLIHDDGIHVLLDLSGHTSHNRLPVFGWKPSPVQASWLGYFSSTGLAEMDYLIADPVSIPESDQPLATEKIWYLPKTRFCFTPPGESEELPPSPLPASRNGHLTFGCFQNLTKLNDAVLSAWGKILQAIPSARLRLQNPRYNTPAMREKLLNRLTRSGICAERVTISDPLPRMEYLAVHAEIDIILDTFPFPGGTTTCEALWMGVPTVTLAGNTMVARQGASLLACVGLSDWIAATVEDYVATAIAHAVDPERLRTLRAGLRRQMLASPLMDAPAFARRFEEALWGMWRNFMGEKKKNRGDENG